jgi:hypothetical protein
MRFFLSLGLQDSFGRRKKMLVETEDLAVVLTDQVTAINEILTILNAVTDLAVVRADWLVQGIGTPFAGAATSNVDVGATFVGELTDKNGERASHKLPGIILSLVDADGSIDLAGAAISEYLDLFKTTGGICKLSDGEQIASWISGALDK